MVKQTKVYEVDNIKALLAEAKSTALIDYQGLSAEQVRQLRWEIRQSGGSMIVTKNTLIAIALRQMGMKLPSPLTGPTALVIATDNEVAPLKAVDKTRQQFDKPEFKLGIYQGKFLSAEELQEFTNLPSKDVLIAQFVGGLINPLQRLIYAMKHNQTKLVLTLKAITEKGGENHD